MLKGPKGPKKIIIPRMCRMENNKSNHSAVILLLKYPRYAIFLFGYFNNFCLLKPPNHCWLNHQPACDLSLTSPAYQAPGGSHTSTEKGDVQKSSSWLFPGGRKNMARSLKKKWGSDFPVSRQHHQIRIYTLVI